MYKNNSRDSSEFKGFGSLQLSYNLTRKCQAIGYYSYTQRYAQAMKKLLTILVRTLIIIFVSILLLWIYLNFRVKNSWDSFYVREEVIQATYEINESFDLPKIFTSTYDSIYPKIREKEFSITRTLLGQNLPATLVARVPSNSFSLKKTPWSHALTDIYLSAAISEYCTPEKCFDYFTSHFDFLHGQIGIDSATHFYYNKDINELSNREIVGLIAMLENPVLFNPFLNRKNYEKKVNKLMNVK